MSEGSSEKIRPSKEIQNDNPSYSWKQSLGEVEVFVPLASAGTRAKEIRVDFHPKTLSVSVANVPVISGSLFREISPDSCTWSIDGGRLAIFLEKVNQMEWWPCVLKGHREIETKQIEPESSNLSDLDPETRATVEKMMFEQRQKASKGQEQERILQKLKEKNPHLDVSPPPWRPFLTPVVFPGQIQLASK